MNIIDGRLHDLKRRLVALSMTGKRIQQRRSSREKFVVFHRLFSILPFLFRVVEIGQTAAGVDAGTR
jgi:hypothetical protein